MDAATVASSTPGTENYVLLERLELELDPPVCSFIVDPATDQRCVRPASWVGWMMCCDSGKASSFICDGHRWMIEGMAVAGIGGCLACGTPGRSDLLRWRKL